ncbi:MAG: hypothetical protein HZC29_04250, partial [Thaumarchaeota archaeon]|nr:hypothetical protein [Nitrososphaerota archaeon]
KSELYLMKNDVDEKASAIETLHSRASEDLVFALKNPLFVEYFELPETKAGNIYQDGVLQFTPRQQELKSKLESWIYNFQNKFQVDETCLIDATGQEHARLVLKNIAPDNDLSPEEASASFFEPSFVTKQDTVHIQYPYVSPDTNRWVFAYSSPVVLGNGEIPAIYHFEMPMTIFHDLVKTDSGRTYIIDRSGYLVADSAFDFTKQQVRETPSEYFPSVNTVSYSNDYKNMLDRISLTDDGTTSYTDNGEIHYLAYKKLPNFEWILVHEKQHSAMVYGSMTLDNLRNDVILLSTIFVGVGLFAVVILSNNIIRPIKTLERICLRNNPESLEPVTFRSKDEVGNVAMALNSLIEHISENNEEIKSQNEELASQNEEMAVQSEEIQNHRIALEEQNKKLLEIDKQKAEFASMLTHELNTPLTPTLNWCNMLLDPKGLGELNERQRAAINKIKTNTIKLHELVRDVLDAEKLDLGQIKFTCKDVNIPQFLNELSENHAPVLAEKQIQFSISCPEGLVLYVDGSRLGQVLKNLINNSVDFVQSETGKIEIKVEKNSEFATFYVIDNGIGTPKEKQKDLFKKFYQIDSSSTRKHGGSGLGLAICRGIIESFNGKIGVDSELGKGTMFYFTIPLKVKVITNQPEM